MSCNTPPASSRATAYRGIPIPEGFRRLSLKEAAAVSGVTLRTLYRHCMEGNVWAWRLFNGNGPWHVVLDTDGLPADPPRSAKHDCSCGRFSDGDAAGGVG